jgi:LPS export ABC transporter protein LptC
MRKISQYILGILFLAFIVEVILVSPNDLGEKKKPAASKIAASGGMGSNKDVDQQMDGIHVIETKSESKEWELWADRAMGFKKQGDLALAKVKASFLGKDGVSFLVTGDNGSVQTESKNMIVDGDVVTKSSNGYVFKTARVDYDSKSRVLNSKTPVTVTGPRDSMGGRMRIEGQEMTASIDDGEIHIERDVKARKTVRINQEMAVQSEHAELSSHGREVKFSGHVIIDMEGVRVTGPDALFHYDGQNDLPRSIELKGGVKMSDLHKWATSDKLNIDLAKNEFVFDGAPRVVQDDDELRGDRIIFLDGGKRVQVQNAKVKVSNDTMMKQGKEYQKKPPEKAGTNEPASH